MRTKVNSGRSVRRYFSNPCTKKIVNAGSGKGDDSSDIEKWLNSGYKLKEPTVSDILKMSCKERNKR